jgi:hypothetical protein
MHARISILGERGTKPVRFARVTSVVLIALTAPSGATGALAVGDPKLFDIIFGDG